MEFRQYKQMCTTDFIPTLLLLKIMKVTWKFWLNSCSEKKKT